VLFWLVSVTVGLNVTKFIISPSGACIICTLNDEDKKYVFCVDARSVAWPAERNESATMNALKWWYFKDSAADLSQ
jgi:hypothetical protein